MRTCNQKCEWNDPSNGCVLPMTTACPMSQVKILGESRPDYEAEYHRLKEENKKIMAENDILRKTIIGMCKSLYGQGGADHA